MRALSIILVSFIVWLTSALSVSAIVVGSAEQSQQNADTWYLAIFLIFLIYGIAEIYLINQSELEKKKKKRFSFIKSKKKAIETKGYRKNKNRKKK